MKRFSLILTALLLGAATAYANLLASVQLPVPVAIAPTSAAVSSQVAAGGTVTPLTVTTQPASTFNGQLTLTSNPGNLFGISGQNLTAPGGLTAGNNGTYSPVVQATENGGSVQRAVTVTVNIQQQQQGCQPDSICPPGNWTLVDNFDFRSGAVPANWDMTGCAVSANGPATPPCLTYGGGWIDNRAIGTSPGIRIDNCPAFGPGVKCLFEGTNPDTSYCNSSNNCSQATTSMFRRGYGYYEYYGIPGDSWGAFWLADANGAHCNAPDITQGAEFDIVEGPVIGGGDFWHMEVLYGNYDPITGNACGGGPRVVLSTADTNPAYTCQVSGLADCNPNHVHLIGLDWEADHYAFYIDGVQMINSSPSPQQDYIAQNSPFGLSPIIVSSWLLWRSQTPEQVAFVRYYQQH